VNSLLKGKRKLNSGSLFKTTSSFGKVKNIVAQKRG